MEIIPVIQYTMIAAQSFDSVDYYNKSLMIIHGLANVLLCT